MVTIVSCDDWVGLYLEGSLKLEGHSLPLRDVIELLVGEAPNRVEADADWIADRGSLPDSLAEVVVS